MAAQSNDPSLVAKALAKALSVETRLNSLMSLPTTPVAPTILYGSSGGATVVTQNANGSYQWTCPAGVFTAQIECWGAGAGGGGGGSGQGGEAGGGGEYACESNMTVIPGTVYTYTVGNGGTGGAGGGSGLGVNGGDSFFNYGGTGTFVYANGGNAGASGTGGHGGTGSVNTLHTNGGSGGGDGSQSTGGCGGGGSGGGGGAGGSGTDSVGTSGTAGGAAGTIGSTTAGAHGGAGGNNTLSGVAGVSPGGGGGGAGANSGLTTLTKQYNASGTRSYYGSDATGSPNGVRSTNSTIWCGGETATGGTYNGTQKSIITFPTAPTIVNDFSGYTMTSCTFSLYCQHTWYGQGSLIPIRAWEAGGGAPSSWNGSSSASAQLAYPSAYAGKTTSYSLGQAVAAAFAAGTYFGITIGPGTPAYNLWNYGYFSGGSSPTLKLSGTIGGASVQAGAGADGQVKITYTPPPTALVAAVQAGSSTGGNTTDAAGNQLAVGFTGQITQINPATSNPNTLETWHLASLGAAYSNQSPDTRCQYRMTAENMVWILGTINTTGAWTTTLFTLPSAYWPALTCFIPCAVFGPTTGSAYLTITTAGVVSPSVPAAASALIIAGAFPSAVAGTL